MDPELKSNSFKSREEDISVPETKKVEQVAKGKLRKRSWFRSAAQDIVNETDGTSIMKDAVVPAVRKGIYDILSGVVDMIFGGGNYIRRERNQDKISYQNYYNQRNRQDNSKPKVTYGFQYEDPIVETRNEAERVYEIMHDLLDHYRMVSVQDLYEAVGLECGPYTDVNYGWLDLSDMTIVKVNGGWLIKMPKIRPIN